MALSEVATIADLVMSTASMIQTAGNNWYKASASWEEFPGKVERLRKKQEFWQAEFTRSGLSSDRSLIETLQNAQLLLEKENAILSKKSASCGAGCWPKLSMTMFPAQLGLSIDNVITAFDNIQGLLIYEEEGAAALEKRVLRRPFSLLVRKDHRYVPMQLSETEVHSALDNVNLDGPAVVLLHGGTGKGKSTLARAVALKYKEAASKTAVFEHVVYLECGPLANILAKQFNLLQLLGGFAAAPVEQAQRSSSDPDLTILKRIRNLLRDQKVLIIFDDVWEGEFLQNMLDLCGRRVKCLVTSQRGDLCRGLNCSLTAVQIQDVQLDDARKILACHVGFQNHLIPENLETIADEMIRETEGNPLALASIASAIDSTRSDEQEVWETASSDLFGMLHLESSEYILNKKYPRSFWATMKLSFDSLEIDARNLLVLVHMCSELSVPEEVIGLFYRSTKLKFGSAPFAKVRKELESRGLVKVTLVSDSPRMQRSWSVHSLVKLFIEAEMKDATETTFTLLTGLSSTEVGSVVELEVDEEVSLEEDTIMITLANFYFHDQFTVRAKMAASKVGIPSHRFNNLTRSAMEPITRLIGQPLSGRWTETLHNSAKRVLMMYICTGVLNDEDILNLLGSSISTLAVMDTIGDIATVEETMLLDESAHYFINALVDILRGVDCGTSVRLREAAGQALCCLCETEVHSTFILNNLPFVLEAIISLLLTEPEPEICSWSALTLNSLCASSEAKALHKVVQYPGAIAFLVNLLNDSNYHPSLKATGASILGNLAFHDEIGLEIVKFGVIESLVKSLSKDDNHDLQEWAAGGLANLANVDEIGLKIVNSNGAIERLLNLLSKDHNSNIQKEAARGLASLVGVDEIGLKIANFNGVIEGLLNLLSKDDNPHIQEIVAEGLANLTNIDVDEATHEISLKIANSPIGVIDWLVKWLSKDDNPNLQENAARVLADLACVDEIGLKVVNSIGAIDWLVKLLFKDDNSDVQEAVAIGLANLAMVDEIRLKIANFNGVIEGLVKLLSKDNNPELQEVAAKGLTNLALGDEICLKIANSSGAIDWLVKLLSKDDNPNLQMNCCQALVSLIVVDGYSNNEAWLKVANFPRAIEELVKTIPILDDPNDQEEVIMYIHDLVEIVFNVRLQGGVQASKLKLNASEGLRDGLLGLLVEHIAPGIQRYAAGALMFIYPEQGSKAHLYSGAAYIGRGYAHMISGLYRESLADFDKVHRHDIHNLPQDEADFFFG